MKHVKTLMAAVVFAAVAAEAENIYWNSSVSYGWNDSRQWKEGKVPTENDQAYLYNNAHVVITDSEWDNFSKAGGVLINNTGSLTFDLSGDKTYKGTLSGTDKARVVKCGEGTLAISPEKSNAYILYSGWLVVSNGSLRVDKVYHYEGAWPGVDICRNARFIYGSAYESSSYFRGIAGEGVFENVAGGQIIVRGKYDASGKVPEYVFSGTFEGESVQLSMGVPSMAVEGEAPCRQVFANEVNENKTTVRLYGGEFSLASIGEGSSASPGSLGMTDTFWFSGSDAETAIRYLGSGETVSARKFRFSNASGQSRIVVDGGPSGGLELANEWTHAPSAYLDGRLTRIVLAGSNTVSCIVSGTLTDTSEDGKAGVTLVKRGSGTWCLKGNEREIRGPVSVESGVLQFDSIAPLGVSCSLGTGTMLHTNYTGIADDCSVPWAIAVGDGRTDASVSDLATLCHSGSTGAVAIARSADRAIAIRGAGALSDSGLAPMEVNDVYSCQIGSNTLVLGGESDNLLHHATNGIGTLERIVKRGGGSWKIGGDVDATAFSVEDGTLEFGAVTNGFTYFRFTVKELQGSVVYMMFRHLAFWDEDGTLVSDGLVWREDCDGYVSALRPGEVAVARRNWVGSDGAQTITQIENLFKDRESTGCYWNGGAVPVLGDPSTWRAFVLRLPAGSKLPVRYDIRDWGSATELSFSRDIKSWTVEGSADGITWTELDARTGTASANNSYAGWHSTPTYNGNFDAAKLVGYPLDYSRYAAPRRPDALTEVSVAAGASFVVNDPVEVSSLAYFADEGAGTIAGVKFADSGVIRVEGTDADAKSLMLSYDLSQCENPAAIEKWTVSVNGRVGRYTVGRATASGVRLDRNGLFIMVK